MSKEEWKDVVGWEGLYQVSDLGRVRSLRSNKIMKNVVVGDRRPRITLSNRGNSRRTFLVYRLQLIAFRGPCPEGMEACHDDGDSMNNHIDNLRWDTHINNEADKKKTGTTNHGERNGNSTLTVQQVANIKTLLEYSSYLQKEIAALCGTTFSQVSAIKMGTTWSHVQLEEVCA